MQGSKKVRKGIKILNKSFGVPRAFYTSNIAIDNRATYCGDMKCIEVAQSRLLR
jgi:hypothetical protein